VNSDSDKSLTSGKPYCKMRLQCPNCKSDNVAIYSRRKYFVKSAICSALILLCYLEFKGLASENDVDPVIIIGVLGSLILSALALIFGIYYFIKALTAKETIYKCNHCKSKLDSSSIIRVQENDPEALLKNIRKTGHSNRTS